LRCTNCQQCHGGAKAGKSCPHCGSSSGFLVVSTVESPTDLQREVAIANMPESLRDEMRKKMPKAVEIVESPSAGQLFSAIKAASIDDILSLERLEIQLRSRGIHISAIDVAEEAISQGLLLKQNDSEYILLQ